MATKRTEATDIHTRFFLFCDYAMTSNDGKLSIIGEFDHLRSSSEKPFLSKSSLVVSMLTTPNRALNLTLQLADIEGNNEILNSPIKVTSAEDGRINLILGFENLVFPGFGLYKAVIVDGKIKVAEARLHIVQVTDPQPAQA